MLYIVCPTCMGLLGHIQLRYEKEYEKINNLDISQELKQQKLIELIHKFDLNICCRMRLMTYIDTIKYIK